MKHCGTQPLETGRLLLRRLSIDDCEMMYNNWASDPEVTRYLRWAPHRSWAETAELLNEWEKHSLTIRRPPSPAPQLHNMFRCVSTLPDAGNTC